MSDFDIVVVGGGHAGVEAACVAARRGARVALVTFDPERIGAMSCNPAIGGLGKGHLVREVDAFDGVIARAADAAAIHYRMLNRSKGSAVWGPRVQADRRLFQAAVQAAIAGQAGLTVIAGEVAALVFQAGRVAGVSLASGETAGARAVILCTGTFLGGTLFRGEEREIGGRVGEASASRLAAQLRDANLPMGRLKTGTPPRLDGRTIDWGALDAQPSDAENWTMSALTPRRRNPQIACAITRTSAETHAIIRANLDRSPLFSGAIDAQGPRYCPSIEDKIHRFGDRDGHQVFLEPEGLDTPTVYPNGVSTSLPVDVQEAMLRSMVGLKDVEITTPGYAVEYDHIDPRALDSGLQIRQLSGLWCAGQINGTTGYEEAAAQGLICGLAASSAVLDMPMPLLDRANSYMAVMVDDLTLHGVTEPYRMLTSRAEYRLRLRASNAATRLTGLADAAGCIGEERSVWFAQRSLKRAAWTGELESTLSPKVLREAGVDIKPGAPARSLAEWLERGLSIADLSPWLPEQFEGDELGVELAEDAAYGPYIARQENELAEVRAAEAIPIPSGFSFCSIPGLSNEMIDRLSRSSPPNLGAAARVPGITPAALSALLVHLRRPIAA